MAGFTDVDFTKLAAANGRPRAEAPRDAPVMSCHFDQTRPAALTPTQAATNYLSRRVTLLSGSADTVNNGDEDQSCGAELEGPSREARAANYVAYVHAIAPNAAHDRVVIPNVAHDADAMFASSLAWPSLFDVQNPKPGGRATVTRQQRRTRAAVPVPVGH